ncbi:MAG: hypothetical protein O3A20_03610 [Planctomycetota bacterium]|nr:hypothetical protein [Planctomycetota bacterium]
MKFTPVLLATLALSVPAFAQRTLDQVSDYHNSSYNAAIPGLVWEQESAVGITGPLAGFELSLNSYLPNDHATVELIAGQVGNLGAVLWTGQVGPSGINFNDHVPVDPMPYGIHVIAGEWFTIRIHGDSQGMGFQGNMYWPNDPYPGNFYLNGASVGSTDNMGFRTFVWTGPIVEVIGSCPGPVTISASGGTPNGSMAMLHGAPGNFTQNSPNKPCLGLQLSLAAPSFAGFMSLNASGVGALNVNLPPAACGRVLQLVDMATCVAAPPVQL